MNESLESELTEYVHELFISQSYVSWVDSLPHLEKGRWYSLIVELDKAECELEKIKEFEAEVSSKFVFSCLKAPYFKKTGELMIVFNIAGFLWSSVVYQIPKEVGSL